MGGWRFGAGVCLASFSIVSAVGSDNANCRAIVAGLASYQEPGELYAQVFAPIDGESSTVAQARGRLEAKTRSLAKTKAAQNQLLVSRFLDAADSPTLWLAAFENTPDPVTRRKRTAAEIAHARALVDYLLARFPPPDASHYSRPFPLRTTAAERAFQKGVAPALRPESDPRRSARAERALRYLGKRETMDDESFDRWVTSDAYRKFVSEVRALSAEELPWLAATAIEGRTALDRSVLVDPGANHRGIFLARAAGQSVVVKKGPLTTLAHEMRMYLLLNKLGLGPRALGLVELEPGSFAICLELLPTGADSKVVERRVRQGLNVVAEALDRSGVSVSQGLVERVRQVVLRMEAGGLGTAEDLQLRLGADGSVEPFDLEGVAHGTTRAYGHTLPSPVESAENLLAILEELARRNQRVLSKSR